MNVLYSNISHCVSVGLVLVFNTNLPLGAYVSCFAIKTDKDCRPLVDIAFIVDSSGSIGRTNWERTKRFLKAVVSKLDVKPSAAHVAAVAYSTYPEVVISFSDAQDTDEVNRLIDGMRWQRGLTYTNRALRLAETDLFQTSNGMRPNVAKVRLFAYIVNRKRRC